MKVMSASEREGLIAEARSKAQADGRPFVHPAVLFSRAGGDDLSRVDAGMLADMAIHAAREIAAWTGEEARVTTEAIGATARGTALSVTGRNMPFLYDSIMAEVTSTHRDIRFAIHPILVRGERGKVELYDPERHGAKAERISHIQIHLAPARGDASADLVSRLRAVLKQVQAAVTGWNPMLRALDRAIADIESHRGDNEADRKESLEFLKWLRNDNFTFLGMREYRYLRTPDGGQVERDTGSGIGILADPDVLVLRLGKHRVTTTPEILAFLEGPDYILVTKANARSIVHRRAHMDYIGIKRFDDEGKVAGELRVVGLFTSTAYTHSVAGIPLLRAKARRVVRSFGYDPQSHSGKSLLNTLESYPRDELFQIEPDLLAAFCDQIGDLAERPRVRALPRIDRFDRFVSIIVYVPRDQYDSDARVKIGAYLAAVYDGYVSAFYPTFPEGGVARVHFIIGRTEGRTPSVGQERLEDDIRAIVERWEDRFAAIVPGDAPAIETSAGYRAQFSPEQAVEDIADLLASTPEHPIRIRFYRGPGDADGGNQLNLKIFHHKEAVPLSRRVPLLENFGFSVISEQTFDLRLSEPAGSQRTVVLHDMELSYAGSGSVSLEAEGEVLEAAFLSVWRGEIDNDGFNRLVLSAGLTAREVLILRVAARYLRQAGITYSQGYIAEALERFPEIAALLVRLFEARFDPALAGEERTGREARHSTEIEAALQSVPSLDDDRILRRYVNFMQAVLRTNFFQRDARGAVIPTLAVKIESRAVEGLPEPRPFREIFLYGPEVEGVHLRFGPVARGGIRWSDRAEDYRTEVLGLVKAQQVKNAVIVPVGAKGGFLPRLLPAGGSREAVFTAGREAYKTFISTMLSITDNIAGDHVVSPADTVRHDGDDPYFVVAADKGTATFSDTANAISQAHDFWLDDAFASGGSAGYDHKKIGITARGAWEAVKRHFREMDIDIQTTPFTVAGVGDMSGDVFGNGMLLSEKIRLIAAFDHRDIFIDPDPDCAGTFAERKRLFELSRSSWQDYDRAKLSAGGMIISRSEKSVRLTPEAAAAIGLSAGPASPLQIMAAILKSPVDLLWFGGIGTYIRGNSESDAEVGDRANDPIRIPAREVGARVIGEGANLGVTQRGRVDFALAGGRLNSDAIDNSAGVNSSDVEVNIKIALASAMREGRLSREERNRLLAAMTDDVAKLVLRNNYLQPLAISLTERLGRRSGDELSGLMTTLEAGGHLDRKVELLPDDIAMGERYAADKPLTRPEIGVLLSYAKIVLFDEIVASSLPDDPYLLPTLVGYFPPAMREAYAGDILGHRLRREIIATVLANDAINRGRPGFVAQLASATGALPADILRAFVLVRDGLGLADLYLKIDALDNAVPGAVQNALYGLVTEAIHAATSRVLKAGGVAGQLGPAVEGLKAAVAALSPILGDVLPAFLAEQTSERQARFAADGVPPDVAGAVAGLSTLAFSPDILGISEESGVSLEPAAAAFFAVTETFRVGRIAASAERIVTSDRYEALALARSQDEISTSRRLITVSALARHSGADDPVAAWVEAGASRVARVRDQIASLTQSGDITVSKMTVAAGLMSDLARTLTL